MKNEITNVQTGEVMTVTPPATLSEQEIAALVAQSIGGQMNIFQSAAVDEGTADTPLKALEKLETEDVLRKHLHISMVHISRATVAEGEIVSRSDYPVVTFDELPGYRYSGGKRLMQLVTTWAKALGDVFECEDKGEKKGYIFEGNRLLPKLNEYITAGNHPAVIFNQERGKNYTDVFVLAI